MYEARVEWVDYAKGLCIIMVVMMHCTLDYGANVGQEGWLHEAVQFARPFRMPDFFLLAGLFLSRSINAPLREYMDRKFLHFAYFYLLWLAIQLSMTEVELLLSDPVAFGALYSHSLISPINTLWFVHMLTIFYMLTRALRRVPVWLVLLSAASLQTLFRMGMIDTGWSVADRFFDRYIYFFVGYAAAPWIFDLAKRAARRPLLTLAALSAWAVINGLLTTVSLDQEPVISLLLGFAGAAAIVSVGSLMSLYQWGSLIRYAGAHSIVIYLSFFLPMKVLILVFGNYPIITDVGLASLVITAVAVLTPLLFHYWIRGTWLGFLYERPSLFRYHSNSEKIRRPQSRVAQTDPGKQDY